MATYTGTFKSDGKIWQTIGGSVLATPKAGTAIKGDAIVAGSDEQSYMHLTAPIVGYTKVSFLTYVMDGVTPPPSVFRTVIITVEEAGWVTTTATIQQAKA
jgi:hypothetical protein